MALSTDFKDDILNESVNEKRKYKMIQNDDATVSFTDVTSYSQTGSEYGAAEVNEERQAINELNSALADIVTPKAFSDWGLTNPGNQNTRFTNAEAKNIKELIFVLQGTHGEEAAYEYVHIKTPFSMMQDAYYWANTTAGKLEIYYSSTSGIVDVRQLPLALRQIFYVKY